MAKTSSKHQALSAEQQHRMTAAVFQCASEQVQEAAPNCYTVLSVHLACIQCHWHIEIGLDKTENGYRSSVTPSDIPGFPKVSLKDCETVTRAIEDAVDVLPELVDLPYRLDVSSPGVFRALTTLHECQFYRHWPVVYHASAQSPRVEGTITSVNETEETVTIQSHSDTLVLNIFSLCWGEGTFPRLELNPPLYMPDDDPSDE